MTKGVTRTRTGARLGRPWAPALARPRKASAGPAARGTGDRALYGMCLAGALLALVLIGAIAYQVISGAWPSITHFGAGFLVHTTWQPNFNRFGAAVYVVDTLVSAVLALALAIPLGVSIGLYLAMVASGRVRSVVGPLVETLAAVPSVILGFWGILVFAPFVQKHVEPFLHDTLGLVLPIFGTPATTGSSVFTASLILSIMVVPIVASIGRDLFLTVPRELQDGATALGATRWEMVRGVVLPWTAPGTVAAAFLGLGRALGEAIAVTQVIGAGSALHISVFETGDTLASRIADQFFGVTSDLHLASLFYLGTVLLAIELLANIGAQLIVRRFDVRKLATR